MIHLFLLSDSSKEQNAKIVAEEMPIGRLLRPLLFDEKLRREGTREAPKLPLRQLQLDWEEFFRQKRIERMKKRRASEEIRANKKLELEELKENEMWKYFALRTFYSIVDSPTSLRQRLYARYPSFEKALHYSAELRDDILSRQMGTASWLRKEGSVANDRAKDWIQAQQNWIRSIRMPKIPIKSPQEIVSDTIEEAEYIVARTKYVLGLSDEFVDRPSPFAFPEVEEETFEETFKEPEQSTEEYSAQAHSLHKYSGRWYHIVARWVMDSRRHDAELAYEVAGLLDTLSSYRLFLV